MSKENEKKDFCPESKTMLRHFGEKTYCWEAGKKADYGAGSWLNKELT